MNIRDGWRLWKLRRELRALLDEDRAIKFPTGVTTSLSLARLRIIGGRIDEIRKEIWRIEHELR